MEDKRSTTLPPGENLIQVILPAYAELLGGFSCAREFCEDHTGFRCGCPTCLHEKGETLILDAPDVEHTEMPKAQQARRVVSEKLGKMVPKLVVPGYPGSLTSPSDQPSEGK
jgi:hypothetical protein